MSPLRKLVILPAVASAGAAAGAGVSHAAVPPVPPRPNVLHIIVDDLGWGDVGFNGQTKIKTPNLDALAAGGVRMTNAYCPSSVCAPTRAAMLSGFHNGHTSVDRNGGDIGTGFRAEDVLLGRVLKQASYKTGIIGKWGFGGSSSGAEMITAPASLPTNHGYDEFYGYLNHTRAHDYFQPYVWQSNPAAPDGVETVATNGTYTHDLFQQRAAQFIAGNAAAAKAGTPFYLEFAPTIPHDQTADITALPGWDAEYTGATYSSWTAGQKQYAAMITRMDAGIGQLVAKLSDPNGDGNTADSIAGNTLIVFTSDNGPTNQTRTTFFDSNGPWRGGKRDLTEGGLRTPWIMKWADEIAPGSTQSRIIEQSDLLPTLADLAGVGETPVGMDGVSFAPLLTGNGVVRDRNYYVYESHESSGGPLNQGPQLWAVRKDGWKLIKWGDGTYRLYNLTTDPTEQTNVVGVAANAAIKTELEALALVEGVEQPTDYAVSYRAWTGANNALVTADSSWSGVGTPAATWSAVVENTAGGSHVATLDASAEFLGFGVRGTNGTQRVIVNNGVTLTGRNEIRISANAQLDLLGGTLQTLRWVDVRAGGTLFGRGNVNGMIYNAGTVAANGGTLTLNGGGVHSGAFTAASGATLDFAAGTHVMDGATLGGLGAVRLGGAATMRYPAGATMTLPGSLRFDLAAGANLDVEHLELLGSSVMTFAAGSNRTQVFKTVAIDSAAKLDLKDNKLITTSAPGSASEGVYDGLQGQVQRAYNFGAWDGAGLTTSMPNALAGITTVGVATGEQIRGLGPTDTDTWGGQTINGASTIAMYTYAGDANLDGQVDAGDYGILDAFIQVPGASGYANGDFNYDGFIDPADYGTIDNTIQFQGPPIPTSASTGVSSATAVPEPAVGAVVALAAFSPSYRRRRRVARPPRLY